MQETNDGRPPTSDTVETCCDGCGSIYVAYRLTLTNLLHGHQPRSRHYCKHCWLVILTRITEDPQGTAITTETPCSAGNRKIVVNRGTGRFGYSQAARELYDLPASSLDIQRDDPHLVQAVEELGNYANDNGSQLKVVVIPDDVAWRVTVGETGQEWVAEEHRTWF